MRRKKNLETDLQNLELVLEQMESPKTTLEDSLKLYHEGMALYQNCLKELQTYQLEVLHLKNPEELVKGDPPLYEPFEEKD